MGSTAGSRAHPVAAPDRLASLRSHRPAADNCPSVEREVERAAHADVVEGGHCRVELEELDIRDGMEWSWPGKVLAISDRRDAETLRGPVRAAILHGGDECFGPLVEAHDDLVRVSVGLRRPRPLAKERVAHVADLRRVALAIMYGPVPGIGSLPAGRMGVPGGTGVARPPTVRFVRRTRPDRGDGSHGPPAHSS